MKAKSILLVALFASAMLFAQIATSQAGSTTSDPHSQHHPATTAPGQTGTGQSSGMQMGNTQSGMHGGMAAMQADMQQMRTQVEQMRTDAQKVQDPNTRAALMQNVAMWQQFLDRMQSHMQMMGQGGMMGMHGMAGQGQQQGCDPASTSGCQMMQEQKPPSNTTPPPKRQ